MPTPLVVDTLQFVVFTESGEGRAALSFWQKAFKAPPLGLNTLSGVSQANGVQGSYNVTLQAQHNRVDLFVAATGASADYDPSIQDMGAATTFALRAIGRFLPGLPVERVAIVASRSKDQPDAEAAVEEVKSAVPGLVAVPGAKDLWYQTTVTRNSAVLPSVKLALIRRWNTGKKALLQVRVESGQAVSIGGPEKMISTDYVDVFSVEPRKLFPKRALALIEELAQAAMALLSNGYEGLLEQGSG